MPFKDNYWESISALRRQFNQAAVTGVADSVFCHLNLFIAGARSFEGAVRLTELALKGSDAL